MTIINPLPFNLQNGTTADATQVMADFNEIVNDTNANAAHNGANSDITSLTGLTTPLSVAQGGTGQTTNAGLGVQGFLFGCTLSNHSGAGAAIDIAAGSARDSTNVDNLTLGSALTNKILANAWTVGSGGGFLDTGSVGNNTYHVYMIKRVDTGVVDAIASLSASAPTLPTNYTLYRRIGSIIRSGGSIILFNQDGDRFQLKTGLQSIGATNPGTSAVTATMSAPSGIVIWANIEVAIETLSGQIYGLVTALDETDRTPSVGDLNAAGFPATGDPAGTLVSSGMMQIKTNTSAQIRYRISFSDAQTVVRINTFGWIDQRGRLY